MPPETRRAHLRRLFAHHAAVVVILCTLAASKNAAAEVRSPCGVRLAGSSTTAAWSAARDKVEERVARLTSTTTDCRLIVVTPETHGASVEFITADQRVARRHIATPDDLLPLVEALLVFEHHPLVIAAPAPEKSDAVRAMPEEAPVAALASERAAPDEPPSNDVVERAKPDAARVLVGAGAGVKASFPNDSVAGVGQIFVGTTYARWELAGFGRWELEHDAHDEESESATKGRLRYSAIGGGAMLGRRQSVGPLVLIGGARAAVYGAEQERAGGAKVDGKSAHRSEHFLDPRVGLYAGCVVSNSSRLRVQGATARVDLADGEATLVVGSMVGAQRALVHLPDGEIAPSPSRFVVAVALGRTRSVKVFEGQVVLRLNEDELAILNAGDVWPRATAAAAAQVGAGGAPTLEGRPAVNGARGAPPGPTAPSAASSARRAHRASAMFDEAISSFVHASYGQADRELRDFIADFPEDSRCEDAAFLSTVARWRMGDGPGAHARAVSYLKAYPTGLRRAEAQQIIDGGR